MCGERGAAELRRVPGGAHEQEAANGIAHTQAADDDWRRVEEWGGSRLKAQVGSYLRLWLNVRARG